MTATLAFLQQVFWAVKALFSLRGAPCEGFFYDFFCFFAKILDFLSLFPLHFCYNTTREHSDKLLLLSARNVFGRFYQ